MDTPLFRAKIENNAALLFVNTRELMVWLLTENLSASLPNSCVSCSGAPFLAEPQQPPSHAPAWPRRRDS
jgi:hypothetical protein